jgi:hypothetical protein
VFLHFVNPTVADALAKWLRNALDAHVDIRLGLAGRLSRNAVVVAAP